MDENTAKNDARQGVNNIAAQVAVQQYQQKIREVMMMRWKAMALDGAMLLGALGMVVLCGVWAEERDGAVKWLYFIVALANLYTASVIVHSAISVWRSLKHMEAGMRFNIELLIRGMKEKDDERRRDH